MCLAIPGQVVKLMEDQIALIDYGGTRREANVMYVRPKLGDWVIVHAGFALQILDEEEARETLALWDEALDAFRQEMAG
ncbi:MAG: HypC/HybG/HupF family hydrogenase formation chaperone [Candidatus Thermoplasmatota archaeon]|nr:HypC/HybG/HupF family hydrogenase formation chaperone [Candidatus Thermoplasmatota archaeon]